MAQENRKAKDKHLPKRSSVSRQFHVQYMNVIKDQDNNYPALYECKLCGATLTREYTLKLHIMSHLNIKRYQCEICKEWYCSKQYLREHMYTHTRERPFKCPEPGCGKTYRQSSKLSYHRRKTGHGIPKGKEESNNSTPRGNAKKMPRRAGRRRKQQPLISSSSSGKSTLSSEKDSESGIDRRSEKGSSETDSVVAPSSSSSGMDTPTRRTKSSLPSSKLIFRIIRDNDDEERARTKNKDVDCDDEIIEQELAEAEVEEELRVQEQDEEEEKMSQSPKDRIAEEIHGLDLDTATDHKLLEPVAFIMTDPTRKKEVENAKETILSSSRGKVGTIGSMLPYLRLGSPH